MTTKLVLCEGKWDLRLLKQYILNSLPHLSPEYFRMENVSENECGVESNKIRALQNDHYPTDTLVKSENGRSFFKDTYASSITTFAESSFDLSLLCNFDYKGVDGWVEDVNEKVAGRYTTPINTSINDQRYSSGPISSYVMDIIIGGQVRKKFGLVGFESNMEEVVGIDKGIHDSDDRKTLIDEFAENRHLDRAISRVMF